MFLLTRVSYCVNRLHLLNMFRMRSSHKKGNGKVQNLHVTILYGYGYTRYAPVQIVKFASQNLLFTWFAPNVAVSVVH
jgi:hypothetical protein